MVMQKGYSNGPFGQVHWRDWGSRKSGAEVLYCLHPAPFSGIAFETIAPLLAIDRRVIAPDFPGHGGSAPHVMTPSIADYAKAIIAVMDDLSEDVPVCLLGFHTGCLVATEIAVLAPDRLRKIVLIDVPAFDTETRAKYLPSACAPLEMTDDLKMLLPAWERGMVKRLATQSADTSFQFFVEQIRHGRAMNSAFYAAFTYDVDVGLRAVKTPTEIIATQSFLLHATRRGADLIPGARLVERLDITRSVLDEAALQTAEDIRKALGA